MKHFTPYSYQEKGIDWILEHNSCALFWGMGMGKTVTTLTALDIMLALGEAKRILVIAPLRVARDTWTNEAYKWDHLRHLRVLPILGDRKNRIAALDHEAEVYVINRENVQWLDEHLKETGKPWSFDTVVIDELSSFKNAAAKRFKVLRRYRGRISHVIGLTGTPASNGLLDLWPQIYLLDQGKRLGRTLGLYRSIYFLPDQMNGHIVYSYRIRNGAEEQIYKKLGDICMSLKKEDLLDLPGQIYQTIELGMPEALKKAYKAFERDLVLELGEEKITAANAAALTNKLLQYANGAIYYEEEPGKPKEVRHIHDIKLDALEELIEEANGQPVLVFYNYKHDHDRIKARIPDARDLRSSEDIEDWNAKKIRVAVAHPASVGHGLNLQHGGHIIIWFGLPWSLELYEQANERLNRPGQTEICQVYHLVMKGTYDERVLAALASKDLTQRGLIEALIMEVEEHGENKK